MYATGLDEVADVATDDVAAAAEVAEAVEPEPATGVSPARMQPVLSVISLGQVTCSKSTVGLSALPNQPKRQLQPGCSAAGNVEQVSLLIPPY